MACQEAFDAHFYVRQMPLEFCRTIEYYVNKELQRNLKGDDVMHNNQVRDYFRLHDRVSKRNVQFLNTLVTMSLFLCSPVITCLLCIIGVAYLGYLVKEKGEEIDTSKIIPFIFYVLIFMLMLFVNLQV